jgi:DNA-3-methyladenine glycosylase
VLLRAGEVVTGADLARQRRDLGRPGSAGRQLADRDLARGPARLCQALDIDRDLDGADVCGPGSPLGIGAAAAPVKTAQICTGPRVGITQAADRPWRYWLAGDNYVSVYRPAKPRAAAPRPVTGGDPENGTMHR